MMDHDPDETPEDGFPLRVATRITGLKPELIRAWESRHAAIRPTRTSGGARRYSSADLERLRLLRDVVGMGRRIGSVARLSDAELRRIVAETNPLEEEAIDGLLDAAARSDAQHVRRVIMAEVEARDSREFVNDFAIPLLVEIGERWASGRYSISAEHLISGILRSILLDQALMVGEGEARPRIVFATPEGEAHDLGSLVAALVAARSSARPIFVGASVPVEDLSKQILSSGADAVVLGLVVLAVDRSEEAIRHLRRRLPPRIGLWIGGAGIRGLAPIRGVERIDTLGRLEARVTQLVLQGAPDENGSAAAGTRRDTRS